MVIAIICFILIAVVTCGSFEIMFRLRPMEKFAFLFVMLFCVGFLISTAVDALYPEGTGAEVQTEATENE